jgi:hypothetical protein
MGIVYGPSADSTQITNPPAATTVDIGCSPATVVVGQTSICTLSVADQAADPRSPNGTVELGSSERADFNAGRRCT